MRSRPSIWSSTVVSTVSGSPTKPRSTTFSMLESGSTTLRRRLARQHHVAVLAAQPDGAAAGLVDVADDLLVDRAGQHHLDDLDGRRVGDAQARGELRLDAEPLQHGLICGPPPCTTTGLIAACSSSTMSRAKGAGELLVAHGVAAVFHHDGFLVVALHIGQRLGQDPGLVGRRGVHGHFLCDVSRGARRRCSTGDGAAPKGEMAIRRARRRAARWRRAAPACRDRSAPRSRRCRDRPRARRRIASAVVAMVRASASAFTLVGLGEHQLVGHRRAVELGEHRRVGGFQPVAGIDQHVDAGEVAPRRQIGVDQPGPGRDLALGAAA